LLSALEKSNFTKKQFISSIMTKISRNSAVMWAAGAVAAVVIIYLVWNAFFN
jgi:hypothetical protein